MITDTTPASAAQTTNVYTIDDRLTLDDIIDYARSTALASHTTRNLVSDQAHPSANDRLIRLRDAMVNLVIDHSRDGAAAAEAFGDVDRLRESCTADREAAAELNISAVC